MPTITVYHHGLTAGVPPGKNNHMRAKRGKVGGWSPSSTRSNTRFLYSVLEDQLTGHGFALSLTLRDCPPTHDDWHRLRRAFFKRLERMGMIRAHWLTEWQRRGVPHLHAAVWLPEDEPYPVQHRRIVDAWVALADSYGAGRGGQHVAGISDSVGWFKYLSKHASRGLHHYQRSSEGIPPGWRRTGRMWGHLGDWPRLESLRFEPDREAFFVFRRIIRRYRLADARADTSRGAARRIVQARRMLQDPDRARAEVRGVSEWVPMSVQLRILSGLAAAGYSVRHEPEA